jgi:hypothetical protein
VTPDDRARLRARCRAEGLSAQATTGVLRNAARQEHWARQGTVPPDVSVGTSPKEANARAWTERVHGAGSHAARSWLSERIASLGTVSDDFSPKAKAEKP